MSTWQVTERATGKVVYAYTSDEAVDWPDYPFAVFNHNLVIPVKAPAQSRRVTKLQFRNLFSPEEKVAIEFASLDNPNGTQEERLQAADLRVFLADVDSATPDPDGTSIDLDDPRTVAGVNALETYGLIATGRAAEILSGNGL